MDVKEVLFMSRGDGEHSYAQTSTYPQKIASLVRPTVASAVASLLEEGFFPCKLLSVADLGCALGPSTVTFMSTVIESVQKKCARSNCPLPELQFYLNDLPGNDFNTLFKSLSNFSQSYEGASCFIMGAPGTFHGRLFPRNSLHLAHSSYSVHWLSQGYVEEEKLDTLNMPHYTASSEEVRGIIDKEGSFQIEHLEIIEVDVGGIAPDEDPHSRGRKVAADARSFTASIISHHLGEGIMDKLYCEKLPTILADDLAKDRRMGVSIIVVLKKHIPMTQ